MYIEKMATQDKKNSEHTKQRPQSFDTFIGQKHIVRIVQTAIHSSQKNEHQLWHILLAWPSWYWKTTLAQIIAHNYWKKFHMITAYAINKPAELISIMTTMNKWDILFIDEIHRLKPIIEEMLYIAMEDFAIDMIMGDWSSIRVPIQPFTLIWATTKSESLSEPLKNRFIYNFHYIDYTEQEKIQTIEHYLNFYQIQYDSNIPYLISKKVDTVPRRIHNLIVTIRDYLIHYHQDLILNTQNWTWCEDRLHISDGWLTTLHQKYIEILKESNWPIWLKTISLQMGMSEESIENEIESLLLKSSIIEKTSRGRILNK